MKKVDLSQKLKELRLAHAYKQVDVAAALGIVRQTYSHYERGSRTPDAAMLYKLAVFYNISVNELLQCTVELDPDLLYYESSQPDSGNNLEEFLEYLKQPRNQRRFREFNNLERKLIYYFELLNHEKQNELLEFARIMSHK